MSGGNPTSVVVKLDNLYTYVYSKDIGGDLYYIISIHNNWRYGQTIDFIKSKLGIENSTDLTKNLFFGGVYQNLQPIKHKQIEILPENYLDQYSPCQNLRFLKDNISLETQKKFKICYDFKEHRIIVPWYDNAGNLVGVTGRYNFNNLGNKPKWKTLKNFSKGDFIYGYWQNKDNIDNILKSNNYVLVGESEKFVMQLDSYGYYNGLALGGCNISERQARLLKNLPVKNIIICFDEGVNAEHTLKECEKLQGGIFNGKEIWCIFDGENKVLPKGSKAAPTDFGKDKFEILLKNFCFKKEKENGS